MSDTKKPAIVQELEITTGASPEAVWKAITEAAQIQNWFAPSITSTGEGVGSELTVSWGGDLAYSTPVTAWEPNKHVQWKSDDMMGPGTALVADWHISTEAGKTKLRYVQSGFGEFDGWEDFFSGTEIGWRYFLHNLKVYLEKHAGKSRRMISSRFPVGVGRALAWKHIGAGKAGQRVTVDLGKPLEAVVELVVEKRAIALRIPSLGDALLFLELEGSGEKFHTGAWLSVYDANTAARIEPAAKQAFERLAAAVR